MSSDDFDKQVVLDTESQISGWFEEMRRGERTPVGLAYLLRNNAALTKELLGSFLGSKDSPESDIKTLEEMIRLYEEAATRVENGFLG